MRFIALATLVAGSVAFAQDPPKPGKEHERLKQHEGTWDAKAKFTFAPGQPAEESTAVYVATMGGGGLWLVDDYKGTLAGSKFEGHGVATWDPAKKKYVFTWIDSMSCHISVGEGDEDKEGNIVSSWEEKGPDGKTQKVKHVMSPVVKDAWTYRFLVVGDDGKETEMGLISYTRKK
jgi:hypothetical protein